MPHPHYETLSQPLLMTKYLRINKHFPTLKKARMFTLDEIDALFTSDGLGQIDFLGEL